MRILYRACQVTDLAGLPGSLFNHGLTVRRPNGSVNANFGTDGYATNGLSTTYDPAVAFVYACIQIRSTPNMVVFALAIDDATAERGDVVRQAEEQQIALTSITGRSVAAQREVILLEARRSSVLGYCTIRSDSGIFRLDKWQSVAGAAEVQRHAEMMLRTGVRAMIDRSGDGFSGASLVNELSRLTPR